MGLYRHDGTRSTKEGFPAAALNDPPVRVTEDVYVSEPYGRGIPHMSGQPVISGVRPSGALAWSPLVDGQPRWQLGLLVTLHP